MSSGCWVTDPAVVAYGALGNVLYRYGTHYEWCGDGYAVTSLQALTPIIYTAYWWTYDSQISYWTEGGVGSDHFRVYRQGKMKECPYGLGCVDTRYPRMDSVIYGNGSWGILDWGT